MKKTQSLQGIDSENKSQVGDNGEEDKKVEDFRLYVQCLCRKISGDIADRVYVGGIPYYSTEDDIRSFFEGCGTITEVDCMTFPDSGKFRGIAIISFKTEAAAKRALDLDGSDMGGFYLKIQPYKTTKATMEPILHQELWRIAKLSSIRFGTDKGNREFRGMAHVISDNNSLMKALKLDQRIVCGRPIKISCAVPKKGGKLQGNQNQIVEEAKIQSTAPPMITSDEV
ncbi:hypothetical protein D5086_020710 [Populus alba]|uniref:Uncharacterized protein n=1 Tax=Populus alba TaxID=43335 RepID=A0ACC4BLF7_POPAL